LPVMVARELVCAITSPAERGPGSAASPWKMWLPDITELVPPITAKCRK